jgi:hypothetical protein
MPIIRKIVLCTDSSVQMEIISEMEDYVTSPKEFGEHYNACAYH